MNAKRSRPGAAGERRARTRTLDLALRLAELWLRDVLCICEGAPELVHAGRPPRSSSSRTPARASATARACARAIELVGETRLSLALNVSEELAARGARLPP